MAQVQQQWTAETILCHLRAQRESLRDLGVQRIGLYGPYARGDQEPGRAIDLTFSMEPLTTVAWMTLWHFLEDDFGVEVDLVPEKDLSAERWLEIEAEVRYIEGLSGLVSEGDQPVRLCRYDPSR